MFSRISVNLWRLTAIIVFTTFLFTSCSDDDDPIAPVEDHFEAIGMIFYTSGIKVAEILRGETTDTFEVHEGELSDHIEIKFYDEDENEIDPPGGEDFSLGWQIDDESVVEVWQHEGEEGDFEFHLRGLEEGETEIEFFVVHGGHNDYRSGKIRVKVEHEDEEHFEAIGMAFYASGVKIGQILRGVTTDTLEVHEGELSDHIEIKFFDENENEIDPPTSDELTLAWEIDNENIVTVTQDAGHEGDFEFHLQGVEEGETNIEFFVVHDGHNDFRSGKIPVKVEHEEGEHFEAIGMAFYSSGIKIGQILRGVTTDTLQAPEGGLSDHIEVKFFDENENEIDAPTSDELTLGWEIDDESIVTVFQHTGEEGDFEFHLQGVEEGETNIEFFVVHDGHNDFRSGKIPVKVEHEDGAHGEPVGLKLIDEDSGNELATVNADGSVAGSLSIANGETSDHIEVEFFDENNVEFQPGVPPHALQVVSGDENVLVITGQEAAEPWAFKIQGASAGSTTITISILANGEVEETFASINVTVN